MAASSLSVGMCCMFRLIFCHCGTLAGLFAANDRSVPITTGRDRGAVELREFDAEADVRAAPTADPASDSAGVTVVPGTLSSSTLSAGSGVDTDEVGLLVDDKPAIAPAAGTGQSGIPQTAFNFVNTIIGSGIIGLPFAMNEAGLWLGIVELVLFAIMTDYSVNILVEAGLQAGKTSYQGVCRAAFGVTGYILASIFMFGMAFGACISYTIIIGDTIPTTFAAFLGPASFLAQRTWMMVLPTVLVMLPLSSLRDIGKLAGTSLLSMLLVLVILVIVVVMGALQQAGPGAVVPPPNAWDFAHSRFLQATGVISFAYVCHHNSFLLYRSLRHSTLQRWRIVTHISVYSAAALCVVMAVGGYVAFFDRSRGNILNSFPLHEPAIIAARLCFAVTMFFTYPLEAYVARHALEEIWVIVCELRHWSVPRFLWPRHLVLTGLVVAASLLIAVLVGDNLGVVLELSGSFNAVALSLVLPALVYIRLVPGPVLSLAKIPAVAMLVFGVFDGITSTALIVYGVITAHAA